MAITYTTQNINGETWRIGSIDGREVERFIDRPLPTPAIRAISKRAFFNRMEAQVSGLEDTLRADAANVATTEPKRTHLRVALRNYDLTTYVNLDESSTQQYATLLQSYGYINGTQKTALLADGTPAEAWNGPR